MPEQEQVTVIIPAFNEKQAIAGVLDGFLALCRRRGWKLLVVDDGSTDGTYEILKNTHGIDLVRHSVNKGNGAAIKSGIRNADTSVIAFADADGQHSPQDLEKVIDALDDADIVIGNRGAGFYSTPLRMPGKLVLKIVAEFLSGHSIPDLNCGLRAVRRDKMLSILHLCPSEFSLPTVATIAFYKAGYAVKYEPITVQKRIGTSTVKYMRHGFHAILLIIKLVTLFDPLRLFIPAAILVFGAGLAYQAWIFAARGLHIYGGSLLAIISGLLIFFFGILADQISAMRLERIFDRPPKKHND